jgi:hypothetical protein
MSKPKDYVALLAKKLRTTAKDFRGSGIHMMQQTYKAPLKKGDHVWDADWGYLMWDGKEWKS